MNLTQEVIEKLKSLKIPAIIAVSGFGGSGKTTFADLIAKELNAAVISIDSFTQGEENVKDYSLWELMDFKRFEKEVLVPFTEGKNPIQYSKFDWDNNVVMDPTEVDHQGFLVVEGVGILRPELMKYYAFTIWIDCPIEEAVRRGKKRDREVWHNPKDELWEGIWKKNDLEYLEQFKPKDSADLIVDNGISQKFYLSYLMGAESIKDNELIDLGIQIVSTKESGSRELQIPASKLTEYIELIKGKLTEGFWNEIIGTEKILFVFKFKDRQVKEFTLDNENEGEIDKLCAEFNGEKPDDTPNVYKYLAENEFYHDFITEHYSTLVNR